MGKSLLLCIAAVLAITSHGQEYLTAESTSFQTITSSSSDCLGSGTWTREGDEMKITVGSEDTPCIFFQALGFNIPSNAFVVGIALSTERVMGGDSNFRDTLVRPGNVGTLATNPGNYPTLSTNGWGAATRTVRYPETGFTMFGTKHIDFTPAYVNSDTFSIGLKVGRGGAAGTAEHTIRNIRVIIQYVVDFPLAPIVQAARNRARGVVAPFELGGTRQDYLRQIYQTVTAFKQYQSETGAIIDPNENNEIQYSTPCYAHAGATLLANQADLPSDLSLPQDLLTSVVNALRFALEDLRTGGCAQGHCHFYTVPAVFAMELLRPLLSTNDYNALASISRETVPETSYGSSWPNSIAGNWGVVAAAGEFFRAQVGLRDTDISDVETVLQSNNHRWTANGLYMDTSSCGGFCSPMAYDHFPRHYMSMILGAGYSGENEQEFRRQNVNAAWTSLLMQSPWGELPNGGRSAQHTWNEAASCVTFEYYAQYYKNLGDNDSAMLFRRAAALSLHAISRHKRSDGSWNVVKNRFPPSARVGYNIYSYYSQYNLLPASMLSTALTYLEEDIPTTSAALTEVGGYAFELYGMTKVISNAGGMYAEVDTMPEGSDGYGLSRVHHRSADPFVTMSGSVGDSSAEGTGQGVGLGPAMRSKIGRIAYTVVESTESFDESRFPLDPILFTTNPSDTQERMWLAPDPSENIPQPRFVIDLRSEVPVTGVFVRNAHNAGFNDRGTAALTIRLSTDNTNWGPARPMTLEQVSSATTVNWESLTWAAETARYVEVVITDHYEKSAALSGFSVQVARVTSAALTVDFGSFDGRFPFDRILWNMDTNVEGDRTEVYIGPDPVDGQNPRFVLDLGSVEKVVGVTARNSHNGEFLDRSTAAMTIRTSIDSSNWGEARTIRFQEYLTVPENPDVDFPLVSEFWSPEDARYVEVVLTEFYSDGHAMNALAIETTGLQVERPVIALSGMGYKAVKQSIFTPDVADADFVSYTMDYEYQSSAAPVQKVRETYQLSSSGTMEVTSTLLGEGLSSVGVRLPAFTSDGSRTTTVLLPTSETNSVCVTLEGDAVSGLGATSALFSVEMVTPGVMSWNHASTSRRSRNGDIVGHDAMVDFDTPQDNPSISYSVTSFANANCIAQESTPAPSPIITESPSSSAPISAPISEPTTSPVTPPVTSPVTSPTVLPTSGSPSGPPSTGSPTPIQPTLAPVVEIQPTNSPVAAPTKSPTRKSKDDTNWSVIIGVGAGACLSLFVIAGFLLKKRASAKQAEELNVVSAKSVPDDYLIEYTA